MLKAKKLRNLSLSAPTELGRPAFLSAASGLVLFQDWLYVIADDDLNLGIFPVQGEAPGNIFPLLSGVLPLEPKARKREKPDFECVALLAAESGSTLDSLLALPSGSTEKRMIGCHVQLGLDGLPKASREIDFSPLYARLKEQFSDLNIEGAVVLGESLMLFQRGNGSSGVNAIIDLDLRQVRIDLETGQLSSKSFQKMESVNLGTLNGIALSFTDATSWEKGAILFVAVAEDTKDTYNDGICVGSVLGVIDAFGKLVKMEEIFPSVKAEGITTRMVNGQIEVLFVTDGDDPSKPAELYSCIGIAQSI